VSSISLYINNKSKDTIYCCHKSLYYSQVTRIQNKNNIFVIVKRVMEDSHPLLRGGRRKEKGYSHGFSTSQMHVLASICDTLFPSIPSNKQVSQDESLSSFYSTSGSQFPFPDEVLFHKFYLSII